MAGTKTKTGGGRGTNQHRVKGTAKRRRGAGSSKTAAQRAAKRAEADAKREQRLQELADQFVEELDAAIEAGSITGSGWKPPWRASLAVMNATTGRPYRGSNFMMIAFSGKPGPFATLKQWNTAGLRIQKGASSIPISVMGFYKDKNDLDANGEPKEKPFFRSAGVFSVEDVVAADDESRTKDEILAELLGREEGLSEQERIQSAEAALQHGCPVEEIPGGGKASYTPAVDKITMPAFEDFNSPGKYYATLGHERIHSTGHPDRLDRDGVAMYLDPSRQGDTSRREKYAREELVAELGAAMLCAELGLEQDARDDHFEYLAGWRKQIAEDPNVLKDAAQQAAKAVRFIQDSAEAAS